MFQKIMAPIDLEHADKLQPARQAAADLGNHYGAPVVYVAATATTPGPMGHTPQEFAQNLQAFADGEATAHGHKTEAHSVICNDPAAEVDSALLQAADDVGADLIVMASHVPGVAENVHLLPNNGGSVASHFKRSVMIIR